jgi:hypothetical protein
VHELLRGSAALEAELDTALSELATAIAALTQLEADLAGVAVQQRVRLGPLHARLAELRHAVVMTRMKDEPLFASIVWEQARKQLELAAEQPRPEPDADARALWKTLAKRLHPDRADSPEDRTEREEWMKLLTQAWSAGDVEQLRRIDEQTRNRTPGRPPDATSSLTDEIAAVRAELTAVRLRSRALVASDLGRMLRRHREDQAVVCYYFVGLEADLQLQIMSAEQELRALLREAA